MTRATRGDAARPFNSAARAGWSSRYAGNRGCSQSKSQRSHDDCPPQGRASPGPRVRGLEVTLLFDGGADMAQPGDGDLHGGRDDDHGRRREDAFLRIVVELERDEEEDDRKEIE